MGKDLQFSVLQFRERKNTFENLRTKIKSSVAPLLYLS